MPGEGKGKRKEKLFGGLFIPRAKEACAKEAELKKKKVFSLNLELELADHMHAVSLGAQAVPQHEADSKAGACSYYFGYSLSHNAAYSRVLNKFVRRQLHPTHLPKSEGLRGNTKLYHCPNIYSKVLIRDRQAGYPSGFLSRTALAPGFPFLTRRLKLRDIS